MDKPWLEHYEPGVPATLVYPNTSIWGLLRTSFEEYPGNKALTMTLRYLPLGLRIGVTFTYRQLQDKAVVAGIPDARRGETVNWWVSSCAGCL